MALRMATNEDGKKTITPSIEESRVAVKAEDVGTGYFHAKDTLAEMFKAP